MIGFSALAVGFLFACGVYMILSRNTQRIVIGFIVLANGVNLLVLTSAGLPEGAVSPLITGAESAVYSDPLPQAFILTAIVIGLGTAAFLLAMATTAHRTMGTDELRDKEWD